MVLSGGWVRGGGLVVFYVNDSPVKLLGAGTFVTPIYPFMRPGKNTIRVEGQHDARMFMKVAVASTRLQRQWRFDKIIAKSWVAPEKDSVTLEFESDWTERPDFDDLSSDPASRAEQEEELRQLVKKWIKCCEKHDGQAMAQSLVPELKSYSPRMKSRSERLRDLKDIVAFVESSDNTLVTKAEDVKIVFGKQTVILYSEINDAREPRFFRFKTSRKDLTPSIGPLRFAKIQGKWIAI
jgi:hypothetical protein